MILYPVLSSWVRNTVETFSDDRDNAKLRILHLVLYSTDQEGPYDQMYEITRQYYAQFPNVKTVYYHFDPTVDGDQLENDILRIRGEETYVPGILQKTVRAFEYFQNDFEQYDYVVRSNISTIINFHRLTVSIEKYSMDSSIDYGSGTNIYDLQWLDSTAGIHDKTHFGTRFAGGTNIILSISSVQSIVRNQDKIDYSVVDDVSIGLFMKNHMPEVEPKNVTQGSIVIMPNFNADYDKIVDFCNQNQDAIVYRNRNDPDRTVDSQQMKILCDLLSNYYSM